MHSLILYYIALWKPLGYAAVFAGLFIEGDIVLFIAAFLTSQGVFDLGDMIIVAFSGTLLGDIFWYFLGYYINGRFVKVSKWIDKVTKPFDEHILSRSFHTILISKFTFSLNRAILFRAGSLKVPLKNFLKADLAAICVWMVLVGGFGYFTSMSLELVRHYLRFAELALLLGLAIFITVFHLISRRSKKAL